MSLFRKPKKPIQRRVFSGYEDDADIENNDNSIGFNENKNKNDRMDIDEEINSGLDSFTRKSEKKRDKREKDRNVKDKTTTKMSLLSFDDEEEGEIFQVKKSSHSKKVMRMLDKERRNKKKNRSTSYIEEDSSPSSHLMTPSVVIKESDFSSSSKHKIKKEITEISNHSIQTEIRTDDFVLVMKKSERPENMILNGRAALCAGRDDMSSDEEDVRAKDHVSGSHKFSQPDNFKKVLESGEIPDAAMIHAARKRRQKAREQGEFIPIEEKEEKKPTRRAHDGEEDESDEEERIDMSAITGAKEREERREKFYSVQQEYSGDESDLEMNEWENQQIRKGVTGAQLVTAQQESVFSQYLIQPMSSYNALHESNLSTGALLEQAYARNCLEKPKQILLSTQKQENKPSGPRMPQEVLKKLTDRLQQVKELNSKHLSDIDRIAMDLKLMKIEAIECEQKAPIAAAKYRFYQELRGYVTDLVECLDEKIPQIVELEKKSITIMAKHSNNLIERRRQDVRDQAKELTDASKPGQSRKGPEDEERIRRAAEREGRRTRRRRDRERNNLSESHLDGMSSDDEISDHDASQYKLQLEQIVIEANILFEDAAEEFSEINEILKKFEEWKRNDIDAYKDAFVSLCLPKILGPLIRLKMITWNPLNDMNCMDIEKMSWYSICMKYGYMVNETEESLLMDPDVRFVPALVEKIILPKITEQIENCWDPLSTSQTLKLVGLLSRLGREYPSLRPSSKTLQTLFTTILDKMKLSLDNDVFIPIFPKQMQEAKTSFFQRQFCSGLKLFRNLLSWQGIVSDIVLKEIAISSLLNRYLLSAMRVCSPTDAISKAHIIVYTLPRIWLQHDSQLLQNMEMFITFLKFVANQLDRRNSVHMESIEKIIKILASLHATL